MKVAYLLILFELACFAQSDKEIRQIQKISEYALKDGIEISANNTDLKKLFQSKADAFNRASKGSLKLSGQDLYSKIESYSQSVCAGQKAYFYDFKKVASEQLPYCWDQMVTSPDSRSMLEELQENINAMNPDRIACHLTKGSGGKIIVSCSAPLIGCLGKGEERVFKKKLHLFDDGEKTARDACNGFIENQRPLRVLRPWTEEVMVKVQEVDQKRLVRPSKGSLKYDLNRFFDQHQNERISQLEKKANDEFEEYSKKLDDELLKENQQDRLTVFGEIKESSVAMLVDNSSSVDKVRSATVKSLKATILGMSEEQEFTVGFISNKRYYLNGGKAWKATPENKKAALEYLDQMASSNSGMTEPFTKALKELKRKNPHLERFYVFTDAAFDPKEVSAMKSYSRNIRVPVNAKAMGENADVGFLTEITRASGGKLLAGTFSLTEIGKQKRALEKAEQNRKKRNEDAEKIRMAKRQEIDQKIANEKQRIQNEGEQLRAKLQAALDCSTQSAR